MTLVEEYNGYGEELESALSLPTAPIAIKLLQSEEDIPEGAIRPKRDLGVHYALCQAFAMSRRQRKSIAMLKEDHWCWAPIISFGLVKFDETQDSFPVITKYVGIEDPEKAKRFVQEFPRLEHDKYIGLVSAPLRTANFEPDVVLVYCNSAQLRTMLMAVKFKTGTLVKSQFDPIDSCVHSIVPVIKNGDYRITLPDPGEHERAMAGVDEIIFSIPQGKLDEFMAGLRVFKGWHKGLERELRPDYPRPTFYNEVFEMWGLEVGEVWKK